MLLNTVCAEIKNYFTFEKDKHIGDFAIVDGLITPSFDIPTDYIRIVGSHLNDGVHKRGESGFSLIDEGEFHGAVWVMSPPADFLELIAKMEAWEAKYCNIDSQAMSPFNSESFGGYSYSKSGGGSGSGSSSGAADAIGLFARQLNPYRRIRL